MREERKEGRKARTNEHKKEGRRDGWTDFMKGLDVLIIFKRLLTEHLLNTYFKFSSAGCQIKQNMSRCKT